MPARFQFLCNFAGEAFRGTGLRGVEDGDLEGSRQFTRSGRGGRLRIETRKKSVEPATLLWCKRRVVRDKRNGLLHGYAPSWSQNDCSVGISCRRVKWR